MRKLAYKVFLWLVDWFFGPKWDEYNMNGHPKIVMGLPTAPYFRLPGMLKGETPKLPNLAPIKYWGDGKKALRAMLADLKAHFVRNAAGQGFFFARDGKEVPYDEYWTQRVWDLINLTGRRAVVDEAFDLVLRALQGVAWPVDFKALEKAVERVPEHAAPDPREMFLSEIRGVREAAEKILANPATLPKGMNLAEVKARLDEYILMDNAVARAKNLKELLRNLVELRPKLKIEGWTTDEWIDVCRWLSAE